MMRASQAFGWSPVHWFETANSAGSIRSTRQSREKVARISAWVTRRDNSFKITEHGRQYYRCAY